MSKAELKYKRRRSSASLQKAQNDNDAKKAAKDKDAKSNANGSDIAKQSADYLKKIASIDVDQLAYESDNGSINDDSKYDDSDIEADLDYDNGVIVKAKTMRDKASKDTNNKVNANNNAIRKAKSLPQLSMQNVFAQMKTKSQKKLDLDAQYKEAIQKLSSHYNGKAKLGKNELQELERIKDEYLTEEAAREYRTIEDNRKDIEAQINEFEQEIKNQEALFRDLVKIAESEAVANEQNIAFDNKNLRHLAEDTVSTFEQENKIFHMGTSISSIREKIAALDEKINDHNARYANLKGHKKVNKVEFDWNAKRRVPWLQINDLYVTVTLSGQDSWPPLIDIRMKKGDAKKFVIYTGMHGDAGGQFTVNEHTENEVFDEKSNGVQIAGRYADPEHVAQDNDTIELIRNRYKDDKDFEISAIDVFGKNNARNLRDPKILKQDIQDNIKAGKVVILAWCMSAEAFTTRPDMPSHKLNGNEEKDYKRKRNDMPIKDIVAENYGKTDAYKMKSSK